MQPSPLKHDGLQFDLQLFARAMSSNKEPVLCHELPKTRDSRNTMRYIHLERALFSQETDEYNVKVAKTLEEACKLVERARASHACYGYYALG